MASDSSIAPWGTQMPKISFNSVLGRLLVKTMPTQLGLISPFKVLSFINAYLVGVCNWKSMTMYLFISPFFRERISSSTVLLLAYSGKNLRYFHVRRNAIILKCEWPKSPDWTFDFWEWLKKNSKSYEDMEREVSQILGFRW